MFELPNVYKASIMAKRPRGSSEKERAFEVEHQPFIIRAESMKDAKREAESLAFETWKTEDGWQSHQAYIARTTPEDYTSITGIQVRGPIIRRRDDPDDEPKFVQIRLGE